MSNQTVQKNKHVIACGLCYLLRVGTHADGFHPENNDGLMAELLRSPDVIHSDMDGLKVPPQSIQAEQAVLGGLMLAVAVVGLAVNIAAFAVLHGGDRHNLNIRGAALHVLADLLGSVAAIAAALVISYTGWMPVDPLLSLGVAALILRSAWILLRKSGHILLEGAPEWLDDAELREALVAAVPAVRERLTEAIERELAITESKATQE